MVLHWYPVGHSSSQVEFEKGADPLVETVDYFLKGNVEGVPLSWDSIVTALKSDHVGGPALAKHLQIVYTQQGREPQQDAAKGKIINLQLDLNCFNPKPH